MANLYKDFVDGLYSDYGDARTDFYDAGMDITDAWTWWSANNDHKAVQRLLWCVQSIVDGVVSMTGPYVGPASLWYLTSALTQAWQYSIEDLPEVTWQSIVEAWMKDDYEGREWTINVIDRMRQILWNEPHLIMFAARPEDKSGDL